MYDVTSGNDLDDRRTPLDSLPTKEIDEKFCDKCNMKFASDKILNIHQKLHNIEKNIFHKNDVTIERELLYEEVKKQLDSVHNRRDVSIIKKKPRRIYKPPSKRIGLTKIRMEDCLRCDACSCIYIDEKDYFKHMRNFHEKYNTIIPRTRRRSPTTRQNLTQNSPKSLNLLIKSNTLTQSSTQEKLVNFNANAYQEINSENIKDDIKNRWRKVLSKHLGFQPEIKEEPDDSIDYNPLLCHVEVKIKTEPPD